MKKIILAFLLSASSFLFANILNPATCGTASANFVYETHTFYLDTYPSTVDQHNASCSNLVGQIVVHPTNNLYRLQKTSFTSGWGSMYCQYSTTSWPLSSETPPPTICPDGQAYNMETCSCPPVIIPTCLATEFLNEQNQCEVCEDPFSMIGGFCVYDPDNDGIEDPQPICNFPNKLCWRTGSLEPLGELMCSTLCSDDGKTSDPFFSRDKCILPNFWKEINGRQTCVANDSTTLVAPDGKTPYSFKDLNISSNPVPDSSVSEVSWCSNCSDYDFNLNGGCSFTDAGGCKCWKTGLQPCPVRPTEFVEDVNNTSKQNDFTQQNTSSDAKKDTANLSKLVALGEENNKYLDGILNTLSDINASSGSETGDSDSALYSNVGAPDITSDVSNINGFLGAIDTAYTNMKGDIDGAISEINTKKSLIENGFTISAIKSRVTSCPTTQTFSLGGGVNSVSQVDYCEALGNFYDVGYLISYVAILVSAVSFMFILIVGL